MLKGSHAVEQAAPFDQVQATLDHVKIGTSPAVPVGSSSVGENLFTTQTIERQCQTPTWQCDRSGSIVGSCAPRIDRCVRGAVEGHMTRRFQDIWKDQCEAAEGVAARFGTVQALDYLIGEKLDVYASCAATRPEFARELPRFLAEIRRIFSRHDIAAYFEGLEQDAGVPNSGPDAKKLEDSGLLMSVEDKKERIKRLQQLKAMLLVETLGTG